jgi:hypothetical protein
MFDVGEQIICVRSGADAPNPWHRGNPLTVGAEYTVLRVVPQHHANGTRLEDLIAVDRSGRLWSHDMFRRRERKTDIGFAYDILAEVTHRRVEGAVLTEVN